jgi:hypothetical protein
MHISDSSLSTVLGSGLTTGGQANNKSIKELNLNDEDIITCDVCVIGGGATGTYAAVRLREDFKKSVLVVERDNQLGGNVNTYVVPGSNIPIDFGVQAYNNLPTTLDFFKRFNIPLEPAVIPPFERNYIDLKTGKGVTPIQANPVIALVNYAQLLQKYAYLVGGYGQLPDPVPQELLEPFGKFVQDNNLQAAVPIFWTFAFGVGNMLSATTLSVMQNFGLLQVNDLFTGGFLTTSRHNNSELYQKASTLLGQDVLYGSTVIGRNWDDEGYNLVKIATPKGMRLVKAKKLLITIPPTLANMQPFNLDVVEEKMFSKWKWLNSYVAVVSDTGLPDDLQIINADEESLFNLPQLPFVWQYDFSGIPGKYTVKLMGDDKFSADDAKKMIADDLARIGGDGTELNGKIPTIDAFASHSPLQLHPSPESLKAGFYKKLYALQGHRNTFYTGHAWAGDYSSVLWQFTEGLLPSMIS